MPGVPGPGQPVRESLSSLQGGKPVSGVRFKQKKTKGIPSFSLCMIQCFQKQDALKRRSLGFVFHVS